MKKVILIALLAALILAPAMAASNPMEKYSGATEKGSLGIGLNLGTNTGVGFSYGMGKFDIIADFGLDNFSFDPFTLTFDAGVAYDVYDIKIKNKLGVTKATLPVTVGLVGACYFKFGNDFKFANSILVPVGIQYSFDKFPCTLYCRLAPGMKIINENKIALGFDFAGYLGALYTF